MTRFLYALTLLAFILTVVMAPPAHADWIYDTALDSARDEDRLDGLSYIAREGSCTPYLVVEVTGSSVEWVSIMVDGVSWGRGPATHPRVSHVDTAFAIAVTPEFVEALREGNRLTLGASDGDMTSISLKGSGKAIRQAREACRSGAAPAPAEPMVATYEGAFDKGSADRIIEHIEELRIATLVLNSTGGLVAEAARLHEYLADNGIRTHVIDRCASACVIAYAGGAVRTADEGARFGFHQVSGLDASASQKLMSLTYTLYAGRGIDPELVIIGGAYTPDDMFWIGFSEADRYGLVTHYTN